MARKQLSNSTIPAMQPEAINKEILEEKPCDINVVRHLLSVKGKPVSRSYIYKLIRLHGLPHDKIGNTYIFYLSLILKWRAERQRKIIPLRSDMQ